MRISLLFLGGALVASAIADDAPPFRTDESSDPSLPWFQLVDGEFPPENSAHYVSGELIGLNHLERTFTLRVDRNDAQEAALLDYPLDAAMLPYGSLSYNDAPAALRDIPLGTHLHGWFYARPEAERFWETRDGKPHARNGERASLEVDFTRCFRLEDDFTFYARKNQDWRIDHVDLAEKKLTATIQQDGKAVGGAKRFDLTSDTAVFRGKEFATLDDLAGAVGQPTQINLTWATLYGPGRILQIWLDEDSRTLATARQRERHRNHIRERGLPGFVAAVDDKEEIVTITFFDGIDPALFEDLTSTNPKALGWPTSESEDGNLSPKGNIIVVRDSLMNYDQVNDRKGGNILKIGEVPVRPGCSGVQIQVRCGMLLEGFRPGKPVRFFPAAWPVISLPQEESFHGRE